MKRHHVRGIGCAFIVSGVALMASLLTGCAGNLRESGQTLVAADGLSTVVAISGAGFKEANPLITSPAGLLASVGIRAGYIEYINKQPEPQRTVGLSEVNAITTVPVVNNITGLVAAKGLGLSASIGNPIALIAGLSAAVYVWFSTADERAFAHVCADARLTRPELVCTFTK